MHGQNHRFANEDHEAVYRSHQVCKVDYMYLTRKYSYVETRTNLQRSNVKIRLAHERCQNRGRHYEIHVSRIGAEHIHKTNQANMSRSHRSRRGFALRTTTRHVTTTMPAMLPNDASRTGKGVTLGRYPVMSTSGEIRAPPTLRQ